MRKAGLNTGQRFTAASTALSNRGKSNRRYKEIFRQPTRVTKFSRKGAAGTAHSRLNFGAGPDSQVSGDVNIPIDIEVTVSCRSTYL